MKTKLYFFLLCIAQVSFSCKLKAAPDSQDVTSYSWRQHYIDSYLEGMTIDSLNQAVLLEPIGDRKGIVSTVIPVFPINQENPAITVNARYKTKNCQSLSIVLTSIGECENIVSTDTIHLPMTEDWKEFSQTVNTENSCLLNVSIEGTGIKNDYAVEAKIVELLMGDNEHLKKMKEKAAAIWISDFEILVDGKKVTNQTEFIDNSSILDISKTIYWNSFDEMPTLSFMDSRILALGESVHGTKTLQQMGIDVLKERILKHGCKTVLLEWPLEKSFYIDRYIKNDPNFTLDEISNSFAASLYDEELIPAFIEWLREYNLNREEKVSFRGIDINTIDLQSQIDLFDFFHTLNRDKHLEEIDSICKLLILTSNRHNRYEEILTILDNSPVLADVMDRNEQELIRHCLNILGKYSSNTNFRFFHRDYAMAETATFIIDHFLEKDETATLYAHLSHSDYADNQMLFMMNYPFLGNQLKNKYKDDYLCIGMLANHGFAFLNDISGKGYAETAELASAPRGSLEFLLNSLGKDFLYLSMDALDCSDVFSLRETGNRGQKIEDQFSYAFPKARMDGVLFAREAVASAKSNAIFDKNQDQNAILINDFKKALDKIKKK
ncbi:MAG: erythromycin esterase family protein [Prevotella sp.]|nr:erythromycin esterase family protein [Prevotella sp.]